MYNINIALLLTYKQLLFRIKIQITFSHIKMWFKFKLNQCHQATFKQNSKMYFELYYIYHINHSFIEKCILSHHHHQSKKGFMDLKHHCLSIIVLLPLLLNQVSEYTPIILIERTHTYLEVVQQIANLKEE